MGLSVPEFPARSATKSKKKTTKKNKPAIPPDMFDQHPLILAAFTGLISGFLLSVPVGPVNVTIINEGARSGFRWGLLIGAGATVMELIYCALAFTGFASFFDGKGVRAALEL